MNSLTLGLMGLYCSLTIAQAYAEKLGVDVKSAGLLGLAVFIITTTGTDGVDVNNWSASGLFVAIVTVLLSVRGFSFAPHSLALFTNSRLDSWVSCRDGLYAADVVSVSYLMK